MDDRDLEARLRTRLHARFDPAPVPPALATNIQRVVATTPARVGFTVRPGSRWLGWSAVAAAAVLVATVVAIGNVPGPAATPSASPAPTHDAATASAQPAQGSWRYFAVLPPTGSQPDRESGRAFDVLRARVRALQVGNSSLESGNGIFVGVSPGGPSDGMILAVLAAPGVVEFVPLPPSDDAGTPVPEVGDPLPVDEPPLFGAEGLASVQIANVGNVPGLDITLTSAAAEAFGQHTAAHVGESFAIVIDGRIAALPVINEPLTDGFVHLTGGSSPVPGLPNPGFAIAAAVLVGGPLPEAWRGARVPGIVSLEFATAAAQAQFPRGTVASTNLTAEDDGDGWQAVWHIVLTGDVGGGIIPCPTPAPSARSCPTAAPIRRVVVDAERGNVIRIEYPTD
jgi:hypothetical protein